MSTTPRRFNPWPYGIIAVFAIFIPATAVLVVMASSHRMELVSGDYYEQEIAFQRQLERVNRTRALGDKARVTLAAAEKQLLVALPSEHAGHLSAGRIQLYRPSAAGLDRRLPLELDAQGRQTVDLNSLPPGLWKVRVQWKVGTEEFFLDESLKL
jgi:nitrogen fixation protein FixH